MTLKSLFKIFLIYMATVVFSILPKEAFSQTLYVSDQLYVPVRGGKGSEFKILHRGLATGTRVDLLEADTGDGWTKIKTNQGLEGWIRSQYLVREPIARIKLQQANAQVSQLSSELDSLKQNLTLLQNENQNNLGVVASLTESESNLSNELEEIKRISGSSIRLQEQNNDLLQQNQLLKNEIEVLRADNKRLSDNQNQRWFIYGGCLVAVGALLSTLLLFLKPKNRYSDWG